MLNQVQVQFSSLSKATYNDLDDWAATRWSPPSVAEMLLYSFFSYQSLFFFSMFACLLAVLEMFRKITATLGWNLLNAKVTQDDHITYFIVISNLEIMIKYYHLDFGKIHCSFEIFCRPSKTSHQSNRMLKKSLSNVAIFVSSLSKKPPEIK